MENIGSKAGCAEEAVTHTKRRQRRRKGGKESNMDEQQIEVGR